MSGNLRTALIALLILGLSAVAARADDDLVEGATINSEAGYAFTMGEFGTLKLSAVKVNGQVSNKCRVSLKAVKSQIAQGVQSKTLKVAPGKGQGLIVYVYLDPRVEGNYFVCDTPGRNCEAEVEVPDPPPSLKAML